MRARTGKTSGKPGFVYVMRLGNGTIKIGSVVRITTYQRLAKLQKDYGEVEMVYSQYVPDAGSAEADLMMKNSEHWMHGEFFRGSMPIPK